MKLVGEGVNGLRIICGLSAASYYVQKVMNCWILLRGGHKSSYHLRKGNSQTRYSLIVSLTTSDQEVELYAPVVAMIIPEFGILVWKMTLSNHVVLSVYVTSHQ